MLSWVVFYASLVCVCAQSINDEDTCLKLNCVGKEYHCVDGRCYCADGYVVSHFQNRCIRCPGLGEKCLGPCCDRYGNGSLQCWQGVCQPCYDEYGKWTCRESLEQILLISSAQVVMGAALVLGVAATLVLLYKLWATTSVRSLGGRSNADSRLSIGSLQLYIEERLRDAPPRYSRAPAAGSAIQPDISYLNNGFVHDSSVPPPPYTAEIKNDVNQNITVHI